MEEVFGAWRRLAEDLFVGLGVEAYEEGVADANSWRTKCAASTEDHPGQRVGVRRGGVEAQQLLTLGDEHSAAFIGQRERFISIELVLGRQGELWLRDILGSQELLGAGTAGSALAVVVPLDVDGHGLSSR